MIGSRCELAPSGDVEERGMAGGALRQKLLCIDLCVCFGLGRLRVFAHVQDLQGQAVAEVYRPHRPLVRSLAAWKDDTPGKDSVDCPAESTDHACRTTSVRLMCVDLTVIGWCLVLMKVAGVL
jgi:hypothetical protein